MPFCCFRFKNLEICVDEVVPAILRIRLMAFFSLLYHRVEDAVAAFRLLVFPPLSVARVFVPQKGSLCSGENFLKRQRGHDCLSQLAERL